MVAKLKRILVAPLASAALAALLLIVTAVAAQQLAGSPPEVRWFTLDNGGGASTDGMLEVTGTIGQPDASAPMTGGAFTVAGGFWAGLADLPYSCTGDIAPAPNGDGFVDVNDLLMVIGSWGAAGAGAGAADINGDNSVDVNDLLALIGAWGTCG